MEITPTMESWRNDARVLMVNKRKFLVSRWSAGADQEIAGLVKEFNYVYDLDDKSRAYFQPRKN